MLFRSRFTVLGGAGITAGAGVRLFGDVAVTPALSATLVGFAPARVLLTDYGKQEKAISRILANHASRRRSHLSASLGQVIRARLHLAPCRPQPGFDGLDRRVQIGFVPISSRLYQRRRSRWTDSPAWVSPSFSEIERMLMAATAVYTTSTPP